MIDRNRLTKIAAVFKEEYPIHYLEDGMMKLTQDFIKKNASICSKEGISHLDVSLAYIKRVPKKDLPAFVALPYSSKVLYEAFLKFMPKKLKMIHEYLMKNDSILSKELVEEHGFPMLDEKIIDKGRSWQRREYFIKREYLIFLVYEMGWHSRIRGEYMLTIPISLRRILIQYYDQPAEATLSPIKELPPTDHVFYGESEIIQEMPRLGIFKKQGFIKKTQRGRPQTAAISKMHRQLKIKEFYPDHKDKLLKSLRSSLLASLLIHLPEKIINAEPQAQINILFQDKYLKEYQGGQGLMAYLKGSSTYDERFYNLPNNEFYSLFKSLPINEWINYDNLANHIKFNLYNTQPYSEPDWASEKLHYVIPKKNYPKYKQYVIEDLYEKAVTIPYIKANCFLFAAFGLLDIAYDTPDMTTLGDSAYSPYDAIKYIRLNKLGAFVLGLKNDYEPPVDIIRSEIVLSTNSLTITINEQDVTAPVILEPFTQRVSPNRFRTAPSFFLQGVSTNMELREKIKEFKQAVKVTLPPNWEAFFKDLENKVNPFQKARGVQVLNIPPDNKELLRLIAKDEYLKHICIKAEGYRIIIKNKDMIPFRKRLQEFGYLVTI